MTRDRCGDAESETMRRSPSLFIVAQPHWSSDRAGWVTQPGPVRKRPFSAISASICEFPCAAYRSTPPHKLLISLTYQKIARFHLGNHAVPDQSFWTGTGQAITRHLSVEKAKKCRVGETRKRVGGLKRPPRAGAPGSVSTVVRSFLQRIVRARHESLVLPRPRCEGICQPSPSITENQPRRPITREISRGIDTPGSIFPGEG